MARETQEALLAAASSPAASELDGARRRPTASMRSEADPRKRTVCRLPTSAAVRSRPPQPPPPLGRRPPAPLHSPIDIALTCPRTVAKVRPTCNTGYTEHYTSSGILYDCRPCDAGKYSLNTGSVRCTSCEAGKYKTLIGPGACTLADCRAGNAFTSPSLANQLLKHR